MSKLTASFCAPTSAEEMCTLVYDNKGCGQMSGQVHKRVQTAISLTVQKGTDTWVDISFACNPATDGTKLQTVIYETKKKAKNTKTETNPEHLSSGERELKHEDK